jgi:hypothetical protein
VYCSGANCLSFCVSALANLKTWAFFQLKTGLTGCPGLWILIRLVMVGAEGFMVVYFHFLESGYCCCLWYL